MSCKKTDKEDGIMHTKTMEGLIGARTNMELVNTPLRVFKEARRKGDVAKMKQAMGYVNDLSDKADEYKAVADEGMKKDAEETRKIAEEQREEAIQKRREERKKLEERIEGNRNPDTVTDTVEISEEGKVLLKDNTVLDSTDSDAAKT
ncbi:MAG: glycosyltransferase family 2 protein, partial [Lachnospiraceae bacterium]|nr:glycosyltransferase family 2 protein [Lachnospiraceae bacterium]